MRNQFFNVNLERKMLKFKFDPDKAIAAVLYLSRKLISEKFKADFHKIFKILYFADRRHLALYGRPVVGDYYVAMDHGPVPSNIYDMFKAARGDSYFCVPGELTNTFAASGHYLKPLKEPDLDVFSESDLECLNESYYENKDLGFSEIREKSHDAAHKRATKDDKISYLDMAKAAGAGHEMLAYIRNLASNDRILNA